MGTAIVTGSVSYRNASITLAGNIVFHVTYSSSDESANFIWGAGNVVTNKESESVIEFLHDVDDCCVAIVESFSPLRIIAIYGISRCREIDQDIDAGAGK